MSQIAQALAKAKERTGLTTAPFAAPGQPVKPAAPVKVKNTQRIWVALLSVVIVVGGLSFWYSGRYSLETEPVISDARPDPSPVAKTTSGNSTTGSTNPAVTDLQPRPEIQDIINSLAISAVMPGQQPRIMLQGRVVSVGQPVDGTIIFSGIKSERLVFTDEEGITYLRRY
jgi:hypothetical protein